MRTRSPQTSAQLANTRRPATSPNTREVTCSCEQDDDRPRRLIAPGCKDINSKICRSTGRRREREREREGKPPGYTSAAMLGKDAAEATGAVFGGEDSSTDLRGLFGNK